MFCRKLSGWTLVFAMMLITKPSFAFYGYSQQDSVASTLTPGSLWTYDYTITNNTFCFGYCLDTVHGLSIPDYQIAVTEFAVPYFKDAGIVNIATPSGWTYQILNTDMFSLGAETLMWTALQDASGNAGVPQYGSQSGFSYQSPFAPGKGPYYSALGNGSSAYGDPAIPLSPDAISAGISTYSMATPLPKALWLMLTGLAALTFASRRKTSAGSPSLAT